MYQPKPDFLEKSRAVFASNAPPSLFDLRTRVAAGATGTTRRDALSALDSLPRLFGRELSAIRASVGTVRDLFVSRTAAELGISQKRFANIRSCVVGALNAYGEKVASITKRIPMTPAWEDLLGLNPNRHYQMALYRLACFCSHMDTAPHEVGQETLLGFFSALEAEEVVKNPHKVLKHTISHWNMCAKRLAGWPQTRLTTPFEQDTFSFPLAKFPQSFQDDLGRWKHRLLAADPLDPDAPVRPLQPITVKTQSALVVRFASALVRSGDVSLDQVSTLRVLVELVHFKSGLRYFLNRLENKPTEYLGKIAKTLLYIAKHYCRLDNEAIIELQRIVKRVEIDRQRQMTPRNRERLRQFDDPDNIDKLLRFPEQERKRGLTEKNPHRAAKCFERALSVAILIFCGLRIKNLRSINLTTDIHRAANKCFLSIDGSKVKNRQNLEFELPDDVAELMDEFIRNHRPRLAGHEGPYLFPGRDGGPMADNTMRWDIEEALRKRAGLIVNPHLLRHIIAKIVVEQDPALCIAVSRHLGHKRIDMTMAHYLGTETRASARHINRLVQDAVKNPPKGSGE